MQPEAPPDDHLLAEIEARAVEMARGAGEVLARLFAKPMEVEYKDGDRKSDPVTPADRESQAFLKQAIGRHFPDHGIVSEEDAEQEDAPVPDFVWVLDPLDGTKNFLSGLPVYACSIGVLYRGAPVVGAVFVPWPVASGGLVLHARRGGGAFADGELLERLQDAEPAGNRLATLPGSFGWTHRFRTPMRGKVGELRMTGSIAYELALTARGVLQYSMTNAPRLWDVAGGAMVVMEAGGLVMVGSRAQRLSGFRTLTWKPLGSFIPSWREGVTTVTELREWSAPLVLGSPGVVRYVTANLRTRRHRRTRLVGAARRLLRRVKGR